MEVRIYNDKFSQNTEIVFFMDKNGKKYVAKKVDLVFEEYNPGDHVEPTIMMDQKLSGDFLRELSDALNNAGYKSSDLNQIEFINNHLQDMRKLVFKNMEI